MTDTCSTYRMKMQEFAIKNRHTNGWNKWIIRMGWFLTNKFEAQVFCHFDKSICTDLFGICCDGKNNQSTFTSHRLQIHWNCAAFAVCTICYDFVLFCYFFFCFRVLNCYPFLPLFVRLIVVYAHYYRNSSCMIRLILHL